MKTIAILFLAWFLAVSQVFAEIGTDNNDPGLLPSDYSSGYWYRGFVQYNGCFKKLDSEEYKFLRTNHIWTPKQAFDFYRSKGEEVDISEENDYVVFRIAGTETVVEVFSTGWESCMQGMIDYRRVVR